MIVNGTTYHDDTSEEIINLLEKAREAKERIRLFYGDTETGEYWMDENNVTGYVGRSTGKEKIPLLINNSRSMGGGGISDNCIVRLFINKMEVYKHPKFNMPKLTIKQESESIPTTNKEYSFSVYADDLVILARFEKQKQAENWIAFMEGKRFCK